MNKKTLATALAASLSLTACTGYTVNGVDTSKKDSGDYCQQNPVVCFAAGAIAIGTLGAVLNHNEKDNGRGPPPPPPPP